MAKKKKKDGIVIGLDLGTTFSAVAIYGADGKPVVIHNKEGERTTPSVVNLADESAPFVGRAAYNQAVFAPEFTARLFKRQMGLVDANNNPIPAFVHPTSGRAYTPQELSAMVIRYLVDSAEQATGQPVIGVVVSVPAYFGDPARVAVRQACEMAGVELLRLTNEPSAAAIVFGLDKKEDGIHCVYDLGGGTFDVTILESKAARFNVRSCDGDRNLGGSDITNRPAQCVADRFKAETGVEISPEKDPVAWMELWEKADRAKCDLSSADKASIMVSAEGKRLQIDITRDEFDVLIADIVGRTREITLRAVQAAGLDVSKIDNVIVTGGSSRIPCVRKMLEELFGKPPRTDIDPDEAVALGAAIVAAGKAVENNLPAVDAEGKRVLPPAISVVDVLSHNLGVMAIDPKTGILRNVVLIPKNTPLPATKRDLFGLAHESQSTARVIIVQGEANAELEACTKIGELVLDGLEPGLMRQERIGITYDFDVDGVVTVQAEDTLSGKRVEAKIENRAGLAKTDQA